MYFAYVYIRQCCNSTQAGPPWEDCSRPINQKNIELLPLGSAPQPDTTIRITDRCLVVMIAYFFCSSLVYLVMKYPTQLLLVMI